MADLEKMIPLLPEGCGVYIFRNAEGEPIYIGKARNIRQRVLGHLRNTGDLKEASIITRSALVDYLVTDTEAEALILEAELVRRHQPRYNILLKDDKKFPWIKVTEEPYPRIFTTRDLTRGGSRLFGPYTDGAALRRTLALVRQIFPIRSCRYRLPEQSPGRPCLNLQMGRCLAPCAGKISSGEYRDMIEAAIKYLSGRSRELSRQLAEMRDSAAAALDFEQAAHWRDQLAHLERITSRQVVALGNELNADLIALSPLKRQALMTLLSFRDGKLVARYDRTIRHLEGEEVPAILGSFLAQHYVSSLTIPEALICQPLPADSELLAQALTGLRGRPVEVRLPANPTERRLMDFARRQGQTKSEELTAAGEGLSARTAKPLLEVQQALGLKDLPRLISAFDISNLSGTDSVGSAVCFKDGRPYKSGYRQFKMAAPGPDDAGMMRELLVRYLAHLAEKGLPKPDLLLVDGGLPQMRSALRARNEAGYELAVAGLAKRLEEVYLEGGEVVSLPRHSVGLHLLQRLRDEAHRFAQRYHHKLREKRMGSSSLQEIRGIGPATARKLLKAFGSARRVREAGREELEKVAGKRAARMIAEWNK